VGVYNRHLAATPNNIEVKAFATFIGYEGRLFKFKVEAFDPAGKVGEGGHTRAIIDTDSLLSREKRCNKS
jgi:fluoroacetyl-CoA thioesterase